MALVQGYAMGHHQLALIVFFSFFLLNTSKYLNCHTE